MQIVRVSALPETLAANTLYLLKTADEVQVVVTGNDAEAVASTITSADVGDLIAQEIGELDISSGVRYAADIAARDAMAADFTKNSLVFVQDATADETVNSGSALYFYTTADETFHKAAEYESLDLQLTWDAIEGRPSSTPTAIDSAVANSHTHANAASLDKFGEEGGEATYGGVLLGNVRSSGHAW